MPDPFDIPAADPASGRLVAEPVPGDNALALSVGELAGKLKRMVEGEFGHVRLRGEISGYKRVASGHCYLSLKDESAVIDGVIWKGNASSLAFAPRDGIEVIATGKLTTYPGRSKYQIVIERMELAGAGALMALLEQLKASLGAEGLFAADRKRPLPFLPRVIGVVTSPTGAVIRDILHRLEDRCPTHVLVWPVKVQGDGSAAEIAAAIRGFDAIAPGGPVPRPDLVIVARGGGSVEDLWSFNEEIVVRAVADCTIPIISAVGHETDTTLCDHAADRRAPTPTAAAEMAVPVIADLRYTVQSHAARTERCARRYHERGRERLEATGRLLPRRDALLGPQRQRSDEAGARLDRGLERRLSVARRELDGATGALRPAILSQRHDRARAQLDAIWRLIGSLNPDNVLDRGYARVTAAGGGATLSTAAAVRAAGAVTLHFARGDTVDAVAGDPVSVPSTAQAPVEPRKPRAYTKAQPEQPTLL